MTATTEKMQFLILGNIPENVNLIYTKHTTDMYNIQIVYLLFINDYLHSCKTIGINEANKSTDVNRNVKSMKMLQSSIINRGMYSDFGFFKKNYKCGSF